MKSLDTRQVAVIVLGLAIVFGSLVGAQLSRETSHQSLGMAFKVSAAPGYNGSRGTVLVFYPGFEQTVNLTRYSRVESLEKVSVQRYFSDGGLQVSLPDLRGGESQTVQISGIPFTSGLQIINSNWIPPVYYASVIQNLSVTLVGVISCSTPFGTSQCESYTLYTGQGNYGTNDYRGLDGAVNVILFASLGTILGGLLLSLKARRVVAYVPFVTLALFALSSFLYVWEDLSLFQAPILTSTPLWAEFVMPFSHSGFSHYSGNIPYFLVVSAGVELLSRDKKNGFPFRICYLVPFVVYLGTAYANGGYGFSTLIGALVAGVWAYLYALYEKKRPGLATNRTILLALISGIAGVGVVINWLIQITIQLPFDSPWTIGEGVYHLAVAFGSGIVCLYLWERRLKALEGGRINRVLQRLVGIRQSKGY